MRNITIRLLYRLRVLALIPLLGWCVQANALSGQVTVSHVLDGDSFETPASGPPVRLLGVNANESIDACAGIHATNAKERLIQLILGRAVTLSGDVTVTYPSHDGGPARPGRFVDIDSTDVGETLLREGLALPYAHATETSRNNKYLDTSAVAQASGIGLWNPTACGSGPDQDIEIVVNVRWDAEGDDSTNVNGEWVDIVNNGNRTLSLQNWRLRDPATRFYEFPSGSSIPAGKLMRIHIGKGTDSALEKYWGLNAAIFDNDIGQGVYLLDPDNDIRATFAYPCRINCDDDLVGKVSIKVNYDAEGDDRINPNGEWVDVTNLTASTIELYGYLLDSFYQFEPVHHLNPLGVLRIRVGKGTDTETVLYRGRTAALFPNSGGTMSLRRNDDVLIAKDTWPEPDTTDQPDGQKWALSAIFSILLEE